MNPNIVVDRIKELWEDAENFTEEEFYEKLQDFATYMKLKPQLLYNTINDRLSEVRLANMHCPDCGNELHEEYDKEYRGECHGFPAYENVYYQRCLSCGWSNQD